MTFLEIVQRLWLESGASGTSPGPTTVVSQTGEYARLVTWANSAWVAIQRKHRDWGWMRQTTSFTTVLNQAVYPLGSGAGTVGVTAANFGAWVPETGRVYLTAAGTNSEQFLPQIDYEAWRNYYQFGATRNAPSQPVEVAISPAKALCLGPVALAGYTVTHDYFSAPVSMSLDADEPTGLPAEYHEIIVWRALMDYAAFDSAPEVYDRANTNYSTMMKDLEADRRPVVQFAGALA